MNTTLPPVTNPHYIRVALPLPMHRFFDYAVDASHIEVFRVGMRVRVLFRNRPAVGIVVAVDVDCDFDPAKALAVTELLDKQPIFEQHQLALATWIAEFYIHPIGEVYAAMLPTLLRKGDDVELSPQEYAVLNNDCVQHLGDDKRKQLLSRSDKQRALFHAVANSKLPITLARKTYSPSAVKALLDKQLISIEEQLPADNTWPLLLNLGEKKRANAEQAIAIAAVNQCREYATFLLEGVTGSGKTEVYLQVIEDVLKKGKQVLILVPEIGLTPQTVKRFESRFGSVVTVWHSALTDHERKRVFQQAKHNQVGVVIGTRSSIFLPLQQLGMIIVDEEHDESFKQQDGLRYHARDVAAYRAKQHNIPLILGTATPSLESLHNALSHKYHHLQLTSRAGQATMPTQHLMDLSALPLNAGIAPAMVTRIQQQLNQGNQVLVYVNRRGYAPALICQKCGHVETCLDCDNPFTVHKTSHNLQCHRCGKYQSYLHKCTQCQSTNITTQGIGTEQIQDMLSKQFSEYSCVRIDSDSTRGKRKLNTLLNEINQHKHQILVGTQILSKGHHFPNVTLALILNVDSFLFSSDYRAPEKLAQLVTQLGGRAGREEKQGEVWLQSYQVGHPLLQDLVNNGYAHFSRTLLQERVAAKLPPVSYQVAIRVEHQELSLVLGFLDYAGQLLGQFKHLHYIGPFPAGVEKKQGRYRFITVAQAASCGYLNKALTQVKQVLSEHEYAPRLRWHIDVMPTDFS